MKNWIENQLQVEYAAKLKIEGAISALEGMLKAIEESARGEAAAEERGADQQSPVVPQPQGDPAAGEDVAAATTVPCAGEVDAD